MPLDACISAHREQAGLARAVNRALRKAYGIGLCSVEELGWLSGSSDPAREPKQFVKAPHPNGFSNAQPKLRDRLCVLIRQYNLNPTLVKAKRQIPGLNLTQRGVETGERQLFEGRSKEMAMPSCRVGLRPHRVGRQIAQDLFFGFDVRFWVIFSSIKCQSGANRSFTARALTDHNEPPRILL
jgi:hypothetical protein